jgi:phage-related protein
VPVDSGPAENRATTPRVQGVRGAAPPESFRGVRQRSAERVGRTGARGMAATEIALIALVFFVLIGFLVVAIVLGASVESQLSTATANLEAALATAYQTFQALVTSVVSTLEQYTTVAVQALEGVVTQGGNGMASIQAYVRNTIEPLLAHTTQEVSDTASSVLRVTGKALDTFSGAAGATVNQLVVWAGGIVTTVTGIIARIFGLLSQLTDTLIGYIFEGVTKSITFLLNLLDEAIEAIASGGSIALTALEDQISAFGSDISAAFAVLDSAYNTLSSFVNTTLYGYLTTGFDAVINAMMTVYKGLLCNIILPLCDAIPIVSCNPIREAGGC